MLAELRKNFTVKECSLGTDPHEVLPKEGVYEHVKDVIPQKGQVYKVENVFVLAVDRDAYDDLSIIGFLWKSLWTSIKVCSR